MKKSKKANKTGSRKSIESKTPRNKIDTQIDSINQSVVAIGENISQTVTVANMANLENLIAELTKTARAQTPETEWPNTQSKIDELLAEILSQEPQIERLKTLKDFFAKKGGQIKETIDRIFSNPLVQKIVTTAASLAAKSLIDGL